MEQSDADRGTLKTLGSSTEEVAELCGRLSRDAERPIVRDEDPYGGRAAWRWTSTKDAWNQLGSWLAAQDLSRFETAARDVLTEQDPTFDLEPQQRMFAALLGKRLRYSSAIRAGPTSSLVQLSLADDLLRPTNGPRRGSVLAERLTRVLLPPSWIAWM